MAGSIGGIKGNLLTNQPNLWAALMRLVCDLLIVMFVIGNPATHFMYESGSFQFYVVLYTTCQTIPYLCVHMLVQTLSNPYNSHHDMFNTDSIISWGERACFTNLRAKFHSLESNGDSHERMEGGNLEYLTSPLAMDTDLGMSREASDTASEGAYQTLLRALPDGIAPCPSEPTLLPAPVVGHRAAPDAIEVGVVLDDGQCCRVYARLAHTPAPANAFPHAIILLRCPNLPLSMCTSRHASAAFLFATRCLRLET